MKEKRSLFKKIFGVEQPPTQTNYKQWELISTTNPVFVPFDGKIFNNDIVRSALRPKAVAIGKLNPKLMKNGESKNLPNVLKKPNPYMSMQDFLMKMTYQRELNHNAFAYIQRDVYGVIQAMYPIHYSCVELLDVGGEVYCRFQFMMGKQMTVPYTDLIHLRKDFYENDFFGEQSIASLKNVMEVIVTTDQGVVNAVKNSAAIKWIMKFNSVLKKEDKELQIKEFVKNYLSINNEGGAAASDPRYDLQQVEDKNFVPNALQMDKYTQRLYSYFGVNENIVQNKYSEDEYLAFYESEIEPILIQLSLALTDVFFTEKEKKLGYKIIFEASNLAFASMKTKLRLVELLDRGILCSNEIRKILNLPPVKGGNEYVRRLDTAPINTEKEVDVDDQE